MGEKLTISWSALSFDEMSVRQLHDVYELRQAVFILEQACLYPDIDSLDLVSVHLLAVNAETNELLAYLRIVPPERIYAEPAIGRVLVRESARGTGIGEKLIDRGLQEAKVRYQCDAVRISAQSYLLNLYQRLGFEPVSKEYLEDGIPHLEMLYRANPIAPADGG